ncbi:MAG: lipid IV(A) 3-deoxy-D-manno-octulosonic acid transferase [Methylobacter sp.]|nr:lipid IV(A) 3-deoxy-D-manno-octulosonic acid transferase [Methylobacter sp.]
MRTLYSFLFFLLVPVILLRLVWRGNKAPAYRYRWAERFAIYNKTFVKDVIWFHAVSVGEAEALFPLVKQIQHQFPDVKLLITTTTPTGSDRIKTVMPSVEHVYLPYDIPFVVNRFMECFRPKLAVIMETEIWPNLFASCGKNEIPLYVINARLSEKSANGYKKFPGLIASALANVKLIAAQTDSDTGRFVAIGAAVEKVKTMGNIKYDLEITDELILRGLNFKADYFAGRFVWLIASTHKDEEIIFFEIYKDLKKRIPELLLAIAPRHPERFHEVKKLCEKEGLSFVMRASDDLCCQSTDVYIVDSIGELKMFYVAADVAFVGGSMVPVGGHNILEAAAVGTPVIFGPFMANFKDIAEGVLRQKAAIQCHDKSEITATIIALYEDSVFRQVLADRAKEFVLQNQGAIARILDKLKQDF